jgi:putative ABC transport system permease protein
MTLRDWRAGELRFLMAALMLSVAALSAVNFFADRMGAGLLRDAHQMLAADMVVESDQPVAADWHAEAQRRGLRSTGTVSMLTMASTATAAAPDSSLTTMVALKAVGDLYPLRGRVKLRGQAPGAGTRSAPHAGDSIAPGAPQPGTAWVDATLQASMNLHPGSVLRIGDHDLKVAAVIAVEPDAGAAFAALAPRVMISSADLAASGLLRQHAIATHRWLLAGEPAQVAAFERWLRERIALQPSQAAHIETLESRSGERRSMLDQAQQFLSLVSLMTALLASVAVAMAAHRFMLRHIDACAMLRCLGLKQAQLTLMYLLEFLMVGLAASIAGAALGYGAHFVLLEWLGKLVMADLPPPGWRPAVQGVATGLVLLLGFALPPVLQLRNVPQVRLLRREQEAPQVRTLASYGAGMAAFTALLVWQTADVALGLGAALGFAAAGALFASVAWLALAALRRTRGWGDHAAWRFAVTDMQRRPAATVAQVVALALGLTALLLLTVLRGDLMAAWKQSTPADAPNHFVVNMQPDQQGAIAAMLRDYGSPSLRPQTRARLTHVNGIAALEHLARSGEQQGPGKRKPANAANAANAAKPGAPAPIDERARDLAERELDIGQAVSLPVANTITSGSWYGMKATVDAAAVPTSIAEGVAEILHIKLGDKLTFDVAGERLLVTVSSLRKVDWRARQISDIFLIHPRFMQDLPYTLSAAVHVPPGDSQFAARLSRAFPNLTVINLTAIIKQLQDSFEQAAAAVEFLFAFTLAAGVLVLYAALAGSQDVRVRQAALLRALGATRKQLSQAQWIEHALTGALAGVLAAAGATLASWALANFVFHVGWTWSPLLWLCGLAVGAACALSGGWMGLRHVLSQPPLQSLRQ